MGSQLITLGTFDGVHKGHQLLIKKTQKEAQARGWTPMVLTFKMPPRMVLKHKGQIKILSSIFEKRYFLKKFGIKNIEFLDFNRAISQITPEKFLNQFLLKKYKAAGVVVGEDFRFGKNRMGGVMDLVRWGKESGVQVWPVPLLKLNRKPVSSRFIREAIEKNNLSWAGHQLGHKYSFAGPVVSGLGIGKKIGSPTANVKVAIGKVLPKGVFVVRGWSWVKPRRGNDFKPQNLGGYFEGVANIGFRPTISKTKDLQIEVHSLKGAKSFQGHYLMVFLEKRLRAEKKFSNLVALKKQIQLDIRRARGILSKIPKLN